MDEEGIGLVLARASELRLKITNCIQRVDEKETKPNGVAEDDDDDVAEEEEEGLLSIRDAMESLEAQLSSLQALQHQQMYEREAALAEIDHSRKKLLEQLKDYKGQDLQVIHEASAFASETVEENNDLLLPPYPIRPSHALLLSRKNPQNGLINVEKTKENHQQKPFKKLRFIINATAKTVLTIVGVVSILGLAGFEPRVRKMGNEFNVLSVFRRRNVETGRENVVCPPGKVLVAEGGEVRCLVKERVEIPFESVVATPDVNYGCG